MTQRQTNGSELLTITMTKEHALAVIHGLEIYQRVSMGHWSWVAEFISAEHGKWDEASREVADALTTTLRVAFTPDMHPNAHKGIGGASDRAKLTYEVQGKMRQAINQHDGVDNVHSYGPLELSGKALPVAKVEDAV